MSGEGDNLVSSEGDNLTISESDNLVGSEGDNLVSSEGDNLANRMTSERDVLVSRDISTGGLRCWDIDKDNKYALRIALHTARLLDNIL